MKYFLIGQIDITDNAVVEPRARLQITHASDRRFVIRVGAGSIIKNDCYIGPRTGYIEIGAGSSINPFCVLLGYGGINIGDNVRIAAHTSIIAFNHSFTEIDVPISRQGNRSTGICIEDDVWIGTGVRVLDGVTIGKGSVIGAGAVVNKSIPPYSVAVGNPARVVKSRLEQNLKSLDRS